MILVKEVIIMRMEGNTDNTVRSKSNFMLDEISWGSSVPLMVIPSLETEMPGAAMASELNINMNNMVRIRNIRHFFFSMAFTARLTFVLLTLR